MPILNSMCPNNDYYTCGQENGLAIHKKVSLQICISETFLNSKHFVLYSIWIVKGLSAFLVWRMLMEVFYLAHFLIEWSIVQQNGSRLFFREISPRNHGTRFSLVESLAIKSFLLLHHVEIKSEVVKNQTLLFNPLSSWLLQSMKLNFGY